MNSGQVRIFKTGMFLIVLCFALLASTTVFAFPKAVGLEVSGAAGFAFKPGGADQFFLNAPSYNNQLYDQVSYSLLTNSTAGNWYGTSHGATYNGIGSSEAKSYFGSLGVSSRGWVSEKNAYPNDYWDWSAGATSTAAFYDSWRVDVPRLFDTVGTVTVAVNLEGNRTNPWRNHGTTLGLSLYDYTTAGGAYLNDNQTILQAGNYLLTIPFAYGIDNNIQMQLASSASTFNEFVGGDSFVKFYNTATITDLTFRDAQGNIVSDFSLITGSGYNYLQNSEVPEPFSLFLLGLGLAGLAGFRRRIQ